MPSVLGCSAAYLVLGWNSMHLVSLTTYFIRAHVSPPYPVNHSCSCMHIRALIWPLSAHIVLGIPPLPVQSYLLGHRSKGKNMNWADGNNRASWVYGQTGQYFLSLNCLSQSSTWQLQLWEHLFCQSQLAACKALGAGDSTDEPSLSRGEAAMHHGRYSLNREPGL